MNTRTYSVSKNGNEKITKNFLVKEFRSKGGADKLIIDLVVVCIAQLIRDITGQPVIINSAYRTAAHNKAVGGASNSKHLLGCALDFCIKGLVPQTYANLAYSIGLNRIGVYSNFVHMDTARSPQWLSQGKFTKINVPYQNRLISRYINREDYLVAIIQYKLNLLGYNMGTEDGKAGPLFEAGVKAFQEKNKLQVDGKVGINTWNKLFN